MLLQHEADALVVMPKRRVNDDESEYPALGGKVSVPLVSEDKRENFLLDVSRGRIDLRKGKYQTRARQVVVLVRLDFGGSTHRNPDLEEIPCPHLHLYREGFGDKWAIPAPIEAFPNLTNLRAALDDFLRYCNVVAPPVFSDGLFS
ncbi:MAG: hypothetical protein HOP29_08375 [Phycisphaerales bacterium]|nr:hypothetical protein [Phycisphaerales bacterium]